MKSGRQAIKESKNMTERKPVERISDEHRAELQTKQRKVERLQAEHQKLAAQMQRSISEKQAAMQEESANLALYILDLLEEYKVDSPGGIESSGIIRRQG